MNKRNNNEKWFGRMTPHIRRVYKWVFCLLWFDVCEKKKRRKKTNVWQTAWSWFGAVRVRRQTVWRQWIDILRNSLPIQHGEIGKCCDSIRFEFLVYNSLSGLIRLKEFSDSNFALRHTFNWRLSASPPRDTSIHTGALSLPLSPIAFDSLALSLLLRRSNISLVVFSFFFQCHYNENVHWYTVSWSCCLIRRRILCALAYIGVHRIRCWRVWVCECVRT